MAAGRTSAASNSGNSNSSNSRTATASKPKTSSQLSQVLRSSPPPEHKEPKDPLDFNDLPVSSLRKYRILHRVPVKSPYSMAGSFLNSPVGRKSQSYKTHDRVSKEECAAACKKQFLAQHVRESDAIVDFIYSVKNQDRAFKLHF